MRRQASRKNTPCTRPETSTRRRITRRPYPRDPVHPATPPSTPGRRLRRLPVHPRAPERAARAGSVVVVLYGLGYVGGVHLWCEVVLGRRYPPRVVDSVGVLCSTVG